MTPVELGPVKLDFPVVQAALSGYSDWPMRVIAKRLGAAYSVCEVMLDQFLVAAKKRAKTRHFLHISEEEHPVGGQLMGAEPDQFAEGAAKLVEEARVALMNKFKLSEIQAQAVLDMQLRRLAALETEKIENEYNTSIFEIAGTSDRIDSFIKEINKLVEIEVVRSGPVALIGTVHTPDFLPSLGIQSDEKRSLLVVVDDVKPSLV